MYSPLTRDDLDELVDHKGEACVSLYMPTIRSGREVLQNSIRFKNLMQRAQDGLARISNPPKPLLEQVRVASRLSDDFEFWQHQHDGLVMFLYREQMRLFQLAASVPEEVHVDEEFVLTPLLPYLQDAGVFYVLAVSDNATQLYRGSRDSFTALEDVELPESLEAVTGSKSPKGFALHSFRVQGQAGGLAVPHGHPDADHDEELRQYFRGIDKAVRAIIRDSSTPLLYAGAEENFALYKEENEHEGLLGECLPGNQEHSRLDELHRSAWERVKEHFRDHHHELMEQFRAAANDSLTDRNIATITTAATQGAVGTLILAERARPTCRMKPFSRITEDAGQDVAAIDHVVNETLRHGGRVIFLEDDEFAEADVGAVYRFAIKDLLVN